MAGGSRRLMPRETRKPSEPPTLDEYIKAASKLARLVRQAFDNPGSVKRDRLLRALREFERVDWRAF